MPYNDKFQELKEKEIKRLTTPVTYKKVRFGSDNAYDCEGNKIINYKDGMHIIEPKKGILTDEEILQYAPNSNEASRVRLKIGTGDLQDKINLYGNYIFMICFLTIFLLEPFLLIWNSYVALLILIIIISGVLYFLFIHNFQKEGSDKFINQLSNESYNEEPKTSTNDDLFLLFESKEKIAREMIEKRFPAPQITNTKFNSVLDNCNEVVKSQIDILNTITPTEKTKYEIASRKKLIKQLISKIDDLTNELILSEENNIEDVVEEMDNLINSVKEYH